MTNKRWAHVWLLLLVALIVVEEGVDEVGFVGVVDGCIGEVEDNVDPFEACVGVVEGCAGLV